MRNGRFGSDGNHNRGRIRDKSLRIINFAASLNTERTEGALEANSFWEIRMRHDEDDANYGGVETKICGEPVPCVPAYILQNGQQISPHQRCVPI